MDNQSLNTINELCPNGYAFMHVSRSSDTQGGGVGLLYNKCYKMEQQQHFPRYSFFEYMETLLRSPTTVLCIGVFYRPPPSTQNGLTVSMFFGEFPALLERIAVASDELLLLGDFNFHIDDTTNRQVSNFLELLNNHDSVQHIIGLTHKDSHTLDLVITRASEDTILRWSIMDPHLSDHKVSCKTVSC